MRKPFHLHWYRRTGRRMAATLSGSYPEFGEGPEDVEYECLCGAKMYKRKHVRGYAERPFRPMEPGRFEKWPYNI